MRGKILSLCVGLTLGGLLGVVTRPALSRLRRHSPSQPDLTRPVKGVRFIRHVAFMDWAKTHPADVLFLGDSLTDLWRDHPDLWAERFAGAANFGVQMDRVENVLWRVEAGEVEAVHPKLVVLQIGANNLADCDAATIASGIEHLVGAIRAKAPNARVILVGMFPADFFGAGDRETVRRVNAELASFAATAPCRFIDLGPAMLKADGSIDEAIQPDRLHLSEAGYRIWADALREASPATRP